MRLLAGAVLVGLGLIALALMNSYATAAFQVVMCYVAIAIGFSLLARGQGKEPVREARKEG